jgi:hypothetical protein
MTRLRKMMLEELQRRNYSAITTRKYLLVVTEFAKYFGKCPVRFENILSALSTTSRQELIATFTDNCWDVM